MYFCLCQLIATPLLIKWIYSFLSKVFMGIWGGGENRGKCGIFLGKCPFGLLFEMGIHMIVSLGLRQGVASPFNLRIGSLLRIRILIVLFAFVIVSRVLVAFSHTLSWWHNPKLYAKSSHKDSFSALSRQQVNRVICPPDYLQEKILPCCMN